MQTPFGHLTYCTNIHAGETWSEHFNALQHSIPSVKQKISPDKPFGIGLRLSNAASLEIEKNENLQHFQQWLQERQCYVFTLNGFPYGGFHHTVVKDNVHAPDWTTGERVDYTIRLGNILVSLLPEGMEGGISTSPLTYRHWHNGQEEKNTAFQQATANMLQVVEAFIQLKAKTGKIIHLDIEPEPDGLLETGKEFLDWYNNWLLPMGTTFLQERLQYSMEDTVIDIKKHVRLCYDVCHFAVGYENHSDVLQELKNQNIRVGKIQISAALKAALPAEAEKRQSVTTAFQRFNEPVYLHQVVAKQNDGSLVRYTDLPEALADAGNVAVTEWRAHYHVPLFVSSYGELQSTQEDIQQVLAHQKEAPFTTDLEIETYTWEVLPEELKLPLADSICRELEWVLDELNKAQ